MTVHLSQNDDGGAVDYALPTLLCMHAEDNVQQRTMTLTWAARGGNTTEILI
jgi:hypothetical protein